jgi:hypothetical protein
MHFQFFYFNLLISFFDDFGFLLLMLVLNFASAPQHSWCTTVFAILPHFPLRDSFDRLAGPS